MYLALVRRTAFPCAASLWRRGRVHPYPGEPVRDDSFIRYHRRGSRSFSSAIMRASTVAGLLLASLGPPRANAAGAPTRVDRSSPVPQGREVRGTSPKRGRQATGPGADPSEGHNRRRNFSRQRKVHDRRGAGRGGDTGRPPDRLQAEEQRRGGRGRRADRARARRPAPGADDHHGAGDRGKKENVANDVAVVDADQLGQVTAQTPLADLQGKVAGANIQANSGAPGGGCRFSCAVRRRSLGRPIRSTWSMASS